MAEVVVVNNTIRVQVTFRGFSGAPEDPVTTTVDIYDSTNNVILHDTPTHISTGVFQFEWTPSLVGIFTIDFLGVFASGQTSIPIIIDVVGSSASISIPAILEQDREFVWITQLDPMFVDPEELQLLFPEADPVEIIELIYQFSVEANDVNESVQPDIPTPLMREYVFASTACALTRIYDPSAGDVLSEVSLGDLSIRSQREIKDMVTRANATTWCELAAVLRAELYRFTSRSGIKAIVKGSNVIRPMPDRDIMSQEWRPVSRSPFWIK